MSAHAPTTAEKLRGLPWSLSANAANSIFAQFTFFGPVFVLFLAELNISNTEIGFLLSLVPFTGLVALFIAPMVARYGYKKTFVTFWGARKGFAALLLAVPFVTSQFGPQGAVFLITIIMIGFSVCRSIAETGYYPWSQEFVPETVRGKYAATNTAISNLVSIIATAIATFVIGLSTDVNRFMILFAVGVTVGVIGVFMYTRIPGGASILAENKPRPNYRDMLGAIRDSNLKYYLVGIFLFTFGTGPLYSFLPIFMEQQVGLSDSNILGLQISVLVGGLVSSQLLGWSADRFGSKPVMLSGVLLSLFLPLGWLLMPRMVTASIYVAMGLAFLQGIATIAWGVGSGRLLFTRIVPTERKSEYMAVYYSIIGLIGGTSQFFGGTLIDASSDLSGTFLFLSLDPFTILMIVSIILPALSIPFFNYVTSDSEVSVTDFAGFFFHGNPVFALETMVRFYRARDEKSAVLLTQRLGQTNSPLTVDEMLTALNDPRFNVRFEAIISIARMDSNDQLIEALTQVLNGTELSLTVMAAWALGRIGDEKALPALRDGLNSDYRSIRAHCARALGTLNDETIIPLLHGRLKVEEDKGLQMAYASSLASMGAVETIPTIFIVMEQTDNDKARMELALAMTRPVGDENHFVSLLRQIGSDMGTALAQDLMRLKTRLTKHDETSFEQVKLCTSATEAFASERFAEGKDHFVALIADLPPPDDHPLVQALWEGCVKGLKRHGIDRIEYVIMALNLLELA